MKRSGFKRKVYVPPPAPPLGRGRMTKMSMIGDEVRAAPKDPRYEDRHLLDMARGKPCLLRTPLCCNDPETTVACHGAGVANGKGMGYKTSDALSVWGCFRCNHFTDAYSGASSEEKAAAFQAGHCRQIDAWRAIADDPRAKPRDRLSARLALEQLSAAELDLAAAPALRSAASQDALQ